MIKTVKLLALMIHLAVFCSVLYGVISYLNTPYLYESWSTKKCAFIELPDSSRISCDEFDPNQRYIHKWAE